MISTRTYIQGVTAADVKMLENPSDGWVELGPDIALMPYGKDKQERLLMLAAIGEAIRAQALELMDYSDIGEEMGS